MRILKSYFWTGIISVKSQRRHCLTQQPWQGLSAEKLWGSQNFLQDPLKEVGMGNAGSLGCNLLGFLTDKYLYRSGFFFLLIWFLSPLLLWFSSLSSPSTHKSGYAGGPTNPTHETQGLALHTRTFFCTTINQKNYSSVLFYPVNILHILWAHRVTPQAECTLCWTLGSQDFHHRLKHLSPSS